MAQSGVKGSLSLAVDEAELIAKLTFIPDPNGQEWTVESIQRLVMDAKIPNFSIKKASELFSKFGSARTELEEIVAEGQAPVETVPEEVQWEDLTPPPELAPLVDEALLEAPQPELYRTKTESVKVEKTVKKAAVLPFLPPKIEKIQTVEKHETRERIYPDFEIKKQGFARKGGKLGLIASSKTGKPGKTIYGRPIPVNAEDPVFICGRGIVRDKSILTAACDGVLRAGMLWAEIIPLAVPSWEVSKSADGASCCLSYTRGDARLPQPEPQQILDQAAALGAEADSLIGIDELKTALASAGSETTVIPLSQRRDARVEVKIDEDGVRATLSVWKARGGGRPLELRDISRAVTSARLKGVKADDFKKTVLEFYRSTDRAELIDYLLAEGRAPTAGKERSLNIALAFMPDERAAEIRSRLLAHPALATSVPSIADFPIDEHSRFAFVARDQKIGALAEAAPGQEGIDVHGQPIPPPPVKTAAIQVFEGASLLEDSVVSSRDGLLIAAESDGRWCFRVIPFKNALIEANVAQDGMTGFVTLKAEEGLGSPLNTDLVLEALAGKGITKGIDSHAVEQAVAEARQGGIVVRRPVAEGKAAVPPGAPKARWIDAAVTAGFVGGAPPQGPLARVSAGSVILALDPPASNTGEAGYDVAGHEIPVPAGAPAEPPFEHDASISESRDTKGIVSFIAGSSGELVLDKKKLSILERLAVNGSVGPATGNIRFPGAVQIQGSVLSGMQVFAAGDIGIGGSVEAALVSSDSSITINEGIRGAKRGTLRAKKCIDIGFAEQALILGVEDVKIRVACTLCNVKTNGRIVMSGPNAQLVGGLYRARKGIDCFDLGSPKGIKTQIRFGQDYLIADMIEAEEREIEKLKGLIVGADHAMAAQTGSGPALERLRQDKVKMVKLLEKRSIRLFDFREKFEEHFTGAEVRVRGTVYPGVVLESHGRFYEVQARKSQVAFTFDKGGRIVERPL